MEMFEAGEFDVATVIYNRFKSAMTQIVTASSSFRRRLPKPAPTATPAPRWAARSTSSSRTRPRSWPTCCRATSPSRSSARCWRTPRAYGSQMTAMDSATRNAGDMIKKLTLQINRSRQASITKELIEIISGAEAI